MNHILSMKNLRNFSGPTIKWMQNLLYCSHIFGLQKCSTHIIIKRQNSESSKNDIGESEHFSGTMEQVAQKIRQRIGLEIGYHTIPKCRQNLLKFQPTHDKLPQRCMKDSYTEAVLPLKEDELIRERYVNHLGRVRMGRMLEELDIFAVWICHRHLNIPSLPKHVPLPYTFVTLLVEKVEFLHPCDPYSNIRFSGHVSWVGVSSMEISINVHQTKGTQLKHVIKAIFIMVARNATSTGPAPVNPLKPANKYEKLCLIEADKRIRLRRSNHIKSVFRAPPLPSEENIMYDLFKLTKGKDAFHLSKRTLPLNSRWMAQSYQTTMIHPFPENRNAANTIFGGYIMRNAAEISFIAASIYALGRPHLKYISDITFLSPINVHSFIKMTAYVVYTADKYMQIMTVVQVADANTFEKVTTNTLNFTYAADHPVEMVLPRSYQESLWYIHGRRKFLELDLMKPKTSESEIEKTSG